MNYEMKFTFEDGSSGYLAHYGVKGMKWHNRLLSRTRNSLGDNQERITNTEFVWGRDRIRPRGTRIGMIGPKSGVKKVKPLASTVKKTAKAKKTKNAKLLPFMAKEPKKKKIFASSTRSSKTKAIIASVLSRAR